MGSSRRKASVYLALLSASWEKMRLHPVRSRAVIRLAYPVALGMLSITLLNVVDTAMLGRLGSVPLAAAGISGVGYFAIVFSLAGIGIGVQTLVSRRYGEGNYRHCGEVLNAGLMLALIAGIPLLIAAPWIAEAVSPLLSADPEVRLLGKTYLRYRFLAALFLLTSQVYVGFFNGIGHTKRQMTSAILTTGANILFDYLLIFGHAGFPRMGVAGAAVASVIATGIGMIYFTLVGTLGPYRARYHLYRGIRSALSWFGPIVRLSLPVMGQRALSHGTFFIFFSIISRIGIAELAATNVLRSVIGLSLMPAIGIAVAAASLVGQNLGARDADKAEGYAWEAAKLAAYLMGGIGILFVAIPRQIFLIYTPDAAVISLGRLPLILLGVIQAFGGIGVVLSRALQGAGNTRFVMLAELVVCTVLYLPIAYFLGVKLGLGITGAWSGELVYWLFLAVVMSWKFHQGTWKHINL